MRVDDHSSDRGRAHQSFRARLLRPTEHLGRDGGGRRGPGRSGPAPKRITRFDRALGRGDEPVLRDASARISEVIAAGEVAAGEGREQLAELRRLAEP